MSYLALARKWRPKQFSEVVGQAHVLTALENALSQNRLHHAYLFSGTRGVGKTTIGRLFAKGLNCETGITSNPCGKCATCVEIDEGRSVDLLEIDAASRTKVEDTRELLDNVQYKPARNRFKVYLIDEVHMLSRHSFNALLKTLEEPPEYVKFLLATTDPQKLPVTILSRCLQFHLKPITVDTIQQQLVDILVHEKVDAEHQALALISHAADGSMRDALSLTDQAIALGSGHITKPTVSMMLGTLDTSLAVKIIQAITTGDAAQVMSTVEQLADNGVDWDSLLLEIGAQLHRIAMYQALPGSLDVSIPDNEKVATLGAKLQPTDVQLYYQIAIKGRQDLVASPSQRVAVEMTLLRMLAFRPATALSSNDIVVTGSAQTQTAPSAANISPSVPVTPASQPPVQGYSAPVESSIPYDAPPQEHYGMPSDNSSEAVYSAPQSSDSVPPSYDSATQGYYPDSVPQHGSPSSVSQPTLNQRSANQQSVHASQQPMTQEPVSQPKTAPVGGLRHQLRSKRQTTASNVTRSGAPTTKKTDASPEPASAIERVAQRSNPRRAVSAISGDASRINAPEQVDENEPYRWRAMNKAVVETNVAPSVKPSTLRKALEHIKTPEMAQRLTVEAAQQDSWAALIEKLNTSKLVQQLALNSAYSKDGSSISLGLRATHAHLNTDRNQSELLASLNSALGESCHLSVEVSEQGTTPLELREKIYQDKLAQAAGALQSDANVQFIVTRFSAELDEESIRPL
ncbi:DNA polymerase III subunit gamma/tau [Vibrio methylphosphonaticus]|uniref:DNA polymerase III subunit gamma/tau n=1 Tax=Vibrio methylphosphonaticus TaxID=2946866 RepID=UPI002029EF7B|nr:DNA polymerase III subunit gamma/tau [Vibrio methylphosphonaticus]MCL9774277.1 DNA polymerase III subunit gamma/tau [Vibrio methylphosphonaticus]